MLNHSAWAAASPSATSGAPIVRSQLCYDWAAPVQAGPDLRSDMIRGNRGSQELAPRHPTV